MDSGSLRRMVAAGVAAMTALTLVHTSAAASPVEAADGPSAAPTEAAAIDWEPCGEPFDGVDCARVEVPLDHADPTGQMIELQLTRVPATVPAEQRIGTLFLNPGGPGGSGAMMAAQAGAYFSAGVGGRFDIVGFDPRGIGASTPLQCFQDEDALYSFLDQQPIFPYRANQQRSFFAHAQQLTALCADRGGPIRDHMSTADVARDLDLLRAAVGDEQLTYLGFSYGSYLGATYVNLFPDRVRAVVLDGVLDPVAWTAGTHPQRYDAQATEDTLGEFFRTCAEAGPDACSFAYRGNLAGRFEAMAASLQRRPLEVDLGDGETMVFTYDSLIGNVVGAMYNPAAWPQLADLLTQVEWLVDERRTDGGQLAAAEAALQDQLVGDEVRGASFPPAYDNSYEGYFGNYCADSDHPSRFVNWAANSVLVEHVSRSGPYWLWYNAPCATWPTAEARYTGPWSAQTSAPVLLVGTRYDVATAYEAAVRTDSLLSNSRLLTYEGWGHTAYGVTPCVTTTVSAYLVDQVVPAEGATCPAAGNPFLPAAQAAGSRPFDLSIGRPPATLLR